MENKLFDWSRRGVVGAIAGLIAVGTVVACGSPAQAAPMTSSMYVHVESTAPVPNTAPDYTSGGDVLPQLPGTMGNPAALGLRSGQVLAVVTATAGPLDGETGATGTALWGSQVVSAYRTGASNEIWRFQRVGTVDAYDRYAQGERWPVYKIVSYALPTPTCLTAAGENPVVSASVETASCDPNQPNQTNQLWLAAGGPMDSQDEAGVDMTTDEPTGYQVDSNPNIVAAQARNDFKSLISLSSVINNGYHTPQALTLKSAGQSRTSHGSPSIVDNPNGLENTYNSLYGLVPVAPAPGSPTKDCSGVTCVYGDDSLVW